MDNGVVVEYVDGRELFYREVPERVESLHRTAPGKQVHVLVTDASKQRGVPVYVDECRTDDEILESPGAGQMTLGPD